jgi:hypothetical protein
MDDILLCITDDESNDDQWLHLASNIVEALTYSFEGVSADIPTIHVVASVEACLEVGLGAIGRGETRTLEGGDRRLSSVVLTPCREIERDWDFGDAMLGRNGDEYKENGALDDLAGLGVVESDVMQGWEGYRDRRMEGAIKSVMERRPVNKIILVGELQAVTELSNKMADIKNAQIIYASESLLDGNIEGLINQLQWLHSADGLGSKVDVHRADMEPMDEEKTELKVKREAVKEAMQLASIFKQLDGRYEPPEEKMMMAAR